MKKLLLLSFLSFCLLSFTTKAQTPFTTIDSVDINNINASVLMHGDLWWNGDTTNGSLGYYSPKCFFPNGSAKNLNFMATLWMSAYDGANKLHVAAQTYRLDNQIEYWPGILDAGDTLTYATSQSWAKIWKVNRTDIQYFQLLSTHTTTNTPQAILTWPAKGNAYAQGNGGASLTITTDMAPFVDLNSNGIYEPLLGEYPDVPGDQALWWVFSDNGPTHAATHARPLGVEVHALAYAYHRNTIIDNVIYYDYTIVNRSVNAYHNFRIGIWDDVEMGYYLDDYIGFDSTWRMGISYNGTNDDGLSGGHPSNSYGTQMPITGVTIIVLPGDTGTNYVPAGSFMTYDNSASVTGLPSSDTQCNFYLHAQYSSVQHLTNTFNGPGMPCGNQGTGPNTNYLYPGDPSDPNQWSECNCNNNPGNRRFVMAGNDFNLMQAQTQHFVMALVTTNLDTNNGCPVAGFTGIKAVADTAWNIYHNPLAPLLYTGLQNVHALNSVSAYPNPAHDILYVEDKLHNIDAATITIYNTIGLKTDIPLSKNGQRCVLDISSLPIGLYNALYRNGNVQTTTRFLKE